MKKSWIDEKLLLSERLKEAKKLRAEKHFASSITEFTKILEQLIIELYNEYYPNLPPNETKKVIDYREKIGKKLEKYSLGHWIGLFSCGNFFKIIEKNLNQPDDPEFVFFTSEVVKTVQELRNRNTHSDKGLICYNHQQIALFIESSISCMLRELKKIKETDLLDQEIAPVEEFVFAPKNIDISREDILSASQNPSIKEYRYAEDYVEIEGKSYSPKGLVAIASGNAISRFTPIAAKKILEDLKFKVKTQEAFTTEDEETEKIDDNIKMSQLSAKEALLHVVSTKIFKTLPELISDIKNNYPDSDGIKTLSQENAIGIIRTAWNDNEKIIVPFKNSAFKFYLERLLNEKLD